MKHKIELSNVEISMLIVALENQKTPDMCKGYYDMIEELQNKLKTYRYKCLKNIKAVK